MSIIIKPQIRETSEIKYHHDTAPGKRYVFVDDKLYSQSEFYIIGRRTEFIPENQPDYIDEYRHNCSSYYLFIGDNEDLSGLKAKVRIDNEEFILESPSSVVIHKKLLHTYKLIKGRGWFIYIVLNPNFNSSLFEGEIKNEKLDVKKLFSKAYRQDKKPKKGERPIEPSKRKLKNPQRWIFVSSKMFPKAGIYAALHQIFSDKPFELKQQLHSNYEDEVYLFFSRTGESLEVNMYSSEKEKIKITSPITVYHPKRAKHKYDYVTGQGFMLVILKESIPGEGYRFIPGNLSSISTLKSPYCGAPWSRI